MIWTSVNCFFVVTLSKCQCYLSGKSHYCWKVLVFFVLNTEKSVLFGNNSLKVPVLLHMNTKNSLLLSHVSPSCLFTEKWLVRQRHVLFCVCVSVCISLHQLTRNADVWQRSRICSSWSLKNYFSSKLTCNSLEFQVWIWVATLYQ